MSEYDPASYLELWVPEQDMKDATGKVVGVKRVLGARVPLGEATERAAVALCAHGNPPCAFCRERARIVLWATFGGDA